MAGKMMGQYEKNRDAERFPACWRTRNDCCGAHFHSSIEVVYLLRGSMVVTLNGQPHTLVAGQGAISSHYTLHSYESTDSEAFVLIVPLDFVPSFQKLLTTHCFQSAVFIDAVGSELPRCMRSIAAACTKAANPILLKGYAYTCMGLLAQRLGLVEIGNRRGADFAREVLSYMQENYLSELTSATVSAHFGYSQSRFLHLFSAQFGYGFCQYLNILRCRHAAGLMLNENIGMAEAAMASGFDTMRTFYRNFKQVFGMTPTQFLHSGAQTLSHGVA